MMRYSYNLDKSDVVFAGAKELNASFKDLAAVCDAIRYKKASTAMSILDSIISEGKPIEYRKFNKGMGSRHELNGRKGRYPIKAASIVRKVLINAYANASNKGYMPEDMYVVHASANKGVINRRYPSKGVRTVMRGGYGYATLRRSDLEFAKVEIGLSNDYSGKSRRLSRIFNAVRLQEEHASKIAKKEKPKPVQTVKEPKPKKPLEAPTASKESAKRIPEDKSERKSETESKNEEGKKVESKNEGKKEDKKVNG